LRTGSFWTRLAAASGIGFAGAAVADYVIGSVKDFPNAAEVAAKASANIWGTWVLLVALAGVFLLWFTATSAARLAEIEGGSGRVATEHRMAGAVIAALLFAEVATQLAARSGGADTGVAALARALVNGPVLAFAAGVYVLAAGDVGTRAGASIPMVSGVIARVSVFLGLGLIAGGGLWLFRDYAWLNDTVFFAFVGWVFVRSVLGTFRWADLDEGAVPVSVAPARRRAAAAPTIAIPVTDLDEDDTYEVPRIARSSRPARPKPKAATRRRASKPKAKPAARKPAPRKTTQPKPSARKPAAKRSPRKAAPTPPPAPPVEEPELEVPASEQSTEELSTLDDLDFGAPDEEGDEL